ncbi:MAG: 30S ribosomal protein S2 [Candidatus Omnitrophica bacterium]|jgi:small subunit ribosomal protein S2|nr:30S ribosomal protein S2 [Candidatus Omnitrophota bacterium]
MEVNIKELLEVGAYFGHPSRQFDSRIKPYIFGKRQGIYIIDIEKTVDKIYRASEFIKIIIMQNKEILFVGTKKQSQNIVKELGEKTGQPYVNYRWIGGTLTNFDILKKRISRLDEIEKLEQSGEINYYTKKEISLILKEKNNLLKKFGGIRYMHRLPSSIIIVDTRKETNAVNEARKKGIPIVGIVDTNGNPDIIDYPIPANDDGYKSIQLVLSKLSESIMEAKNEKEIIEKAKNIEEENVQPNRTN